MAIRRSVNIIVWRGKAYLPCVVLHPSGALIDVEPVYIADLSVDSLLAAASNVLDAGLATIPNVSPKEINPEGSPVLRSAKAHSEKQMAKTGVVYSIIWTDESIQIEMSSLDEKGRWLFDPSKKRVLDIETPLSEALAIVLADARSRPSVWQET